METGEWHRTCVPILSIAAVQEHGETILDVTTPSLAMLIQAIV